MRLRWWCEALRVHMASRDACEQRRRLAKKRPGDISLAPCRECNGPVEVREMEGGEPRCKYHPERPAVLRKDGRSTGRCQECLREQTRAARAHRKPRRSKQERRALPPVGRVLRPWAERVREQLDGEGVRQAAAELLAALDTLAACGLLPGWEEGDEA